MAEHMPVTTAMAAMTVMSFLSTFCEARYRMAASISRSVGRAISPARYPSA